MLRSRSSRTITAAVYDEFFEAAIEMKMPLSFHILTSREGIAIFGAGQVELLHVHHSRQSRNITGRFHLGGVFDSLKIACVEADAGWVPHFMYRMDHAYDRHRYWLDMYKLSKIPSEYFRETIHDLPDDRVAFKSTDTRHASTDVGE